ncbi:helix-turn-helix domain-containing protein [Streptomyces monashensis]|uniref:helix-turn-helix domain-containing protein n=1 Tax=Streptomyces monashensis TaxID=1678012 RepID=UPI0033C98DA0
MPGPKGVPRAAIVALLGEGLSDKRIARILHVSPMRVSRTRRELDLPRFERTVTAVEQSWTDRTRPTDVGHLAWAGFWREGVHPVLKHQGTEYSARRLAFRLANGREPEGHVMAGCGWTPCVRPEHVEDQPMRDALRSQFTAIFGDAA